MFRSARAMLPDAPFCINPGSCENHISICAIRPTLFTYGGGGKMQYIEIMFKSYILLVVTTPMAYLQDVSEGSKMAGLGLGTWVFLLFVAVLMVTFAVCAVRKLAKSG